jgi:hypothetical protein
MNLIDTRTKSLPIKLAPEAFAVKARELTSLLQERSSLEVTHKNRRDQMKEEISNLESRIGLTAGIVSRGEEFKDILVDIFMGDNDTVIIKRHDTGETIEARPAQDEERQMALHLFEKEEAAAQAKQGASQTKTEVNVPPGPPIPPTPAGLLEAPAVEGEFKEVTEEEVSTGPGSTSVQNMPHSSYVPPAGQGEDSQEESPAAGLKVFPEVAIKIPGAEDKDQRYHITIGKCHKVGNTLIDTTLKCLIYMGYKQETPLGMAAALVNKFQKSENLDQIIAILNPEDAVLVTEEAD